MYVWGMNGWTCIEVRDRPPRWSTVWITKSGYVGLHAYRTGHWEITSKATSTADNPKGVIRQGLAARPRLEDAIRTAMEVAESIGALPMRSS